MAAAGITESSTQTDPITAVETPSSHTTSTLAVLPPELKRAIINYINRPTDLKNLCLTSRQLRDITTPILYRSVHLFVGGAQDLRLSAFISRENPGLQHVREIFLRLEKTFVQNKSRRHTGYHTDDSSDEDESEEPPADAARRAQFTVRLLLDHLPRDSLEIFSWQNWEPLSVDNFLLLVRNQKKLRDLEIGPMDRSLFPELERFKPEGPKGFFEQLKDLNSIDLYPDTLDRLKAAHELLKLNPGVKHLFITNGFEYSDESNRDDLHDSSTRPGLMSRTLFSHMMPFESCTSFVLKTLDLDTIELRYAADTWLRVIQFNALEKLEVRNCGGADVLWAQLSKPHQRPTKLKSLRWMDDEKSSNPAMEAFDGLLESINGLEVIHVYVFKVNVGPKISSLVHHKKTLRSLSIYTEETATPPPPPIGYSPDDFARLCNECKEIRQLSMVFPQINADWTLYNGPFAGFAASALNLPNLCLLNIRTWPTNTTPTTTGRGFQGGYNEALATLHSYEYKLARLSEWLFNLSDAHAKLHKFGLGNRSHLSVIAWGGNGKTKHNWEDRWRLKQIPFVRGWREDPFRNREMCALKTTWRMVQFIESECEILNHSLYDMHDVHQGRSLYPG